MAYMRMSPTCFVYVTRGSDGHFEVMCSPHAPWHDQQAHNRFDLKSRRATVRHLQRMWWLGYDFPRSVLYRQILFTPPTLVRRVVWRVRYMIISAIPLPVWSRWSERREALDDRLFARERNIRLLHAAASRNAEKMGALLERSYRAPTLTTGVDTTSTGP